MKRGQTAVTSDGATSIVGGQFGPPKGEGGSNAEAGELGVHMAAAKGDAYSLSMLLGDRTGAARGSDATSLMDSVDGNDWTPLHYACQKGSKKCAHVLLRGGCKIDVADSSGWTPLMEVRVQ
eukprot:SAG31_NODE_3546_length_4100_cov_3.507182_2_plen_122_part_00